MNDVKCLPARLPAGQPASQPASQPAASQLLICPIGLVTNTVSQLGTIPAFKLFNSTEPDVLRLLFEHRPADSQVGVLTLSSVGCAVAAV